jgi:hypothetical protein
MLLLLLLMQPTYLVESRLVMVYSIQRHGARNVLPKTSDLKENEASGGPTLLPEGQRQCYLAGKLAACIQPPWANLGQPSAQCNCQGLLLVSAFHDKCLHMSDRCVQALHSIGATSTPPARVAQAAVTPA